MAKSKSLDWTGEDRGYPEHLYLENLKKYGK